MFTNLRLHNFKSWVDTGDLRLAPITALFGPNSSGKTSLIQALLLLKQTTESSDRHVPLDFGNQSSLVNLGGFESVVHDHNIANDLYFSLHWLTDTPVPIPPETKKAEGQKSLGFETVLAGEKSNGKALRVVVRDITYHAGESTFSIERNEGSKPNYNLTSEGWSLTFQRPQGRPWSLPAPEQFHRFPDEVRSRFLNAEFLADLELALELQFRQTYYLGPLRAAPQRTYVWNGVQPTDMGRAGENAVAAILSASDRGEMISRGKGRARETLKEYVARMLKQSGLIADFIVEPLSDGSQIFNVLVRKTISSPYVLLTDVGFGVSQILPVIVLCFYVPVGSTIILEQPEIHLHPAVQSALADILIDAIKHRSVQIILESHSEHLLRRIQRRIADGSLSEPNAALYFCGNDGDHSTASPLKLDSMGNISNWPDDFFGDQFGELAETEMARLKRMATPHG